MPSVNMAADDTDLVLYHYTFSPYARRVVWYLALRGIPYAQCMQPPVMPRPDIAVLGIAYRRIPLMAIGGDVYCDTRLMLQKLEQKFPQGALGASKADQKAIERLLEKWTIETLFARAAQLIPPEMPLLKDPKFQADRKDFSGRNWDQKTQSAARPEALAHIRDAFAFLETTLLADGRDWILKTEKPSLADIEAVFLFHWLIGLKGALPPTLISAQQFPKVYDWVSRFDKAVKSAQNAVPKPTSLKGDMAAEKILNAGSYSNVSILPNDPSGLGQGSFVEVFPVDSGFTHKDKGKLVGLNEEEIVIEVKAPADKRLRVHFPRLNFRLRAVGNNSAKM